MKWAVVLFAAALALGPTGCSTADGPAQSAAAGERRQCFFPSAISGYSRAGEDRVYVHTGPRQAYLFETFGGCDDLDWTEAIGIEQTGGGTICSGLDVTLIVPTSIGPRRCPVKMIRKLTEEEAADL